MRRIVLLCMVAIIMSSYSMSAVASDDISEGVFVASEAEDTTVHSDISESEVEPEGWDGATDEDFNKNEMRPVQCDVEPGGVATYATTSGTWVKASDGRWWYKYSDGTYPANCWAKIDGKWYHFDSDGWMQTGWLKLSGKWYYLSSSGAMVTGRWIINDKYQYFDSSGEWIYRYVPDYNRTKAINYADSWALTPNEDYIYYSGNDCTNYVSQCLLAGGMGEDSTWYAPSYFNSVKAWSTAPGLRDYLESERVGRKLSTWAYSERTYNGGKAWKYTNDSNQLTSDNSGRVVVFYDWTGDLTFEHASIFVINNGVSLADVNGEKGLKGDLIDQHSNYRKHALWHPFVRDPETNGAVMCAYEIRTN